MIKKLEEVQKDLNELRNNGIQRGNDIGWSFDNLPITFKPASTTYIGAAPHVGKTEFILEILINLSCRHGWKHLIFSPETGTPTEIYAELLSKYIGKDFIQGDYAMTELERAEAEVFIAEHFYIIDPVDEELTIDEFYRMVDELEINEGVKLNTTLIDPWNELTESFSHEDLGREDKYLSRILGQCRRNARKTNRHNIIINHVRDQAVQKLDNGTFYFPMPSPRDMAGGQVWYRKGMLMIMLWRPPLGWQNPTNGEETILDNELIVKVAKSKPKGVSVNGVYKMYFDFKKKQYYQLVNDKQVYADRGHHNNREVSVQVPRESLSLNSRRNENFYEVDKEDMPF